MQEEKACGAAQAGPATGAAVPQRRGFVGCTQTHARVPLLACPPTPRQLAQPQQSGSGATGGSAAARGRIAAPRTAARNAATNAGKTASLRARRYSARRTQQQEDLSVLTLRPSPGRTVAPPAREAIGWLAIRCLIAADIVWGRGEGATCGNIRCPTWAL